VSAALRAQRLVPIDGDDPEQEERWLDVCALDDIVPDTGVCALVRGEQVALVRVGPGDRIHAIDNFDPLSKAFVLSRGIVGDRKGIAKIASPLYKQSFDLGTGQCLDDASVRVGVWEVRVRGGRVEVGARLPVPAAEVAP
jgi:nitrite reductase (NADH) small subunit